MVFFAFLFDVNKNVCYIINKEAMMNSRDLYRVRFHNPIEQRDHEVVDKFPSQVKLIRSLLSLGVKEMTISLAENELFSPKKEKA